MTETPETMTTVVIAETQAKALFWQSQGKRGRVVIAWELKDLPPRMCKVVTLGQWWYHPLAQRKEFFDWRFKYGDWSGAIAARNAASQAALKTFPGSAPGQPR